MIAAVITTHNSFAGDKTAVGVAAAQVPDWSSTDLNFFLHGSPKNETCSNTSRRFKKSLPSPLRDSRAAHRSSARSVCTADVLQVRIHRSLAHHRFDFVTALTWSYEVSPTKETTISSSRNGPSLSERDSSIWKE